MQLTEKERQYMTEDRANAIKAYCKAIFDGFIRDREQRRFAIVAHMGRTAANEKLFRYKVTEYIKERSKKQCR